MSAVTPGPLSLFLLRGGLGFLGIYFLGRRYPKSLLSNVFQSTSVMSWSCVFFTWTLSGHAQ